MNTQSSAVPESPLDPSKIPPAATRATRPLYWSVRRELWEYRSIYMAPLAVAGVALFGFLIATIGRAMASPSLAQRRQVLEEPYAFATGLIMVTAFIVSVFYSLDALHGERRDRSILFWKSLPVSDLTTVLAKASIPLVVLPLLSFVITVATQLIMLLLSSIVLLGSGLSVATLWTQASSFLMALLYHLVTVHMLWYAPIYGWLLLVSGWARRVAFLWAGLPLLAICAVERIAFNTTHFAALLKYRLMGPEVFQLPGPGRLAMGSMTHFSPEKFLSSPGLWIGLAVAAIFLAAAVRLRRYREPI
ncbi:MAG: ABC transporter permease [Acidobacteriia bacterium]|nr:ABC transporter permease [Terriglobia bacterium]